MKEPPMTIFEIAIETLFSASEPCDGVGCIVYGMFDDDAAPEYDLELAAHLPEPMNPVRDGVGRHCIFGRPVELVAARLAAKLTC